MSPCQQYLSHNSVAASLTVRCGQAYHRRFCQLRYIVHWKQSKFPLDLYSCYSLLAVLTAAFQLYYTVNDYYLNSMPYPLSVTDLHNTQNYIKSV